MIVYMNRCREQLLEGVADYNASSTAVIPSDLEVICQLRFASLYFLRVVGLVLRVQDPNMLNPRLDSLLKHTGSQ